MILKSTFKSMRGQNQLWLAARGTAWLGRGGAATRLDQGPERAALRNIPQLAMGQRARRNRPYPWSVEEACTFLEKA